MDVQGLRAERGFVVSVGVECSAPVVEGGIRRDQLRLTGHWDRTSEDLGITRSLGVRSIRYGVPFHVIAADPERLDWDWTDRALDAVRDAGLEPVVDLLHFGVPDDLAGVTDPGLLPRYRAYVEAFVRRHPDVRCWTPVNEPWITAAMSARDGCWNERLRSQEALAEAIVALAECVAEANAIIRAARPDAVLLQSEACERWVAGSDEPAVLAEAELRNEQRFLGFQLAHGMEPLPAALDWLLRHGVPDGRLAALLDRGSPEGALMGHDVYPGSEHLIFAPGRSRGRDPEGGYASLAREYHAQLPLPFAIAETNREDGDAPRWLRQLWREACEVHAEGLPIRGLCWYGLVDMIDWDSSLTRVAGNVNQVGLVDLDRRERSVTPVFRAIAEAAAAGRMQPLDLEPLPEAA